MLTHVFGKVIDEHPDMRFHDFRVVNLSFFVDEGSHHFGATLGNLEARTDFVFNTLDHPEAQCPTRNSNSQRNGCSRIFFPEGTQILKQIEPITFPSKTVLVDDNPLWGIFLAQGAIHLIK